MSRTPIVREEDLEIFADANGQSLSLVWGDNNQFKDTGRAVLVEGPVRLKGDYYDAGFIFNYYSAPTPWGSTRDIIDDHREEGGVVVGHGSCKIQVDYKPATLAALSSLPKYKDRIF
jgi:hypothetical protein